MAVGLIRAVSIMVRRWFNMLATARTQRTWRRAVTDRFLDVPLAFHQRRPAGQLLAHADADVEVATTMLKPLAFSLSVIVLAVASLVSLLMVHILFAAVAVVMFPTLTLLNRRFTRMVEAPAAEGKRRWVSCRASRTRASTAPSSSRPWVGRAPRWSGSPTPPGCCGATA
ncbi:MAG: hypothetical protein CM1200mP26_03410 [Acidimicrobiales bacterium]|nr:MAG: hypothetical protein CM1200mP26_03410 [Acidimicrobiales bacterium]